MPVPNHCDLMVKAILAAGVSALVTTPGIVIDSTTVVTKVGGLQTNHCKVITSLYVLTYQECCCDRIDQDNVLHLLLRGVPLVVLPGHMGVVVVAAAGPLAGFILSSVWVALLSLGPSSILVH